MIKRILRETNFKKSNPEWFYDEDSFEPPAEQNISDELRVVLEKVKRVEGRLKAFEEKSEEQQDNTGGEIKSLLHGLTLVTENIILATGLLVFLINLYGTSLLIDWGDWVESFQSWRGLKR